MTELQADIKARLVQAIRPHRLNGKVWLDLLTMPPHYVNLVAAQKMSFEELRRIYLRKDEIYAPSGSHKRAPRTGGSDARLEALAAIAAHEAEASATGVDAFRRAILGEELIDPAEIPHWMATQIEAEGQPSKRAITLPLHSDDLESAAGEASALCQIGDREGAVQALHRYLEWLAAHPSVEFPSGVDLPVERLSFFAPGGPVQEMEIRRDGVLGRLKRLAASLSLFFKWPEHHAVAFVLSDWTPPYPSWQLAYEEAFLPALRRIDLKLDPRLPNSHVVQLYNEARAALGRERDRPMSEKHLRLAVFIAERRRTDEPWTALREEWNRLQPKLRYAVSNDPSARRFALDCRNAWSRVTGQRWPGKAKTRPAEEHEKHAERIIQSLRANLASASDEEDAQS